MDSVESSVVFKSPLRNTGLIIDEAIPAATAATGAHLILVLLLPILLRPLQLLNPLELPPTPSSSSSSKSSMAGMRFVLLYIRSRRRSAHTPAVHVLVPPELLPAPDPM